MGEFLKILHIHLQYDSNIPFLGVYQRECIQRLRTNVHSSYICNNPKVEKNILKQVNVKETVVYSYRRILTNINKGALNIQPHYHTELKKVDK